MYPNDPVNGNDFSGEAWWDDAWDSVQSVVSKAADWVIENKYEIAGAIVATVAVVAICGATAGIGCAILAGAAVGAAVGTGVYVAKTIESGGTITVGGIVENALGGAVAGGTGGAIGYVGGKVLTTAAPIVKGTVGKLASKLSVPAIAESKLLGVGSKLFGNSKFTTNGLPGILNKPGSVLKIGWSGTKEFGGGYSFRLGVEVNPLKTNTAQRHKDFMFVSNKITDLIK